MNFKKIAATIAALAIAVSTMAVSTFAEDTTAAATEATINNTGTAGAMKLKAAALENLTITSAKAFNMSGSVLSNVQVANITVDDGAYTGVNLAKISSLTLAGSGVTGTGTTNSSANTGALGGDNAYDMNVVATGLKGGLQTGTINVGAGQNITVNASEVTGAVTLGDIGKGTAGTFGKNVTVTTDGTGGAVDLSDVKATGLVTLTNSGASTYNVDTISAGSLSVNTSGTVGDVTLGTGVPGGNITTTGALTITNASVGAFTATAISASTTGDVTVNLAGTLGAVNLGTIEGKTVNVDLSNTIGGVATFGTVTALNSVTAKLSEFQANDTAGSGALTVNAATGSTALAVAVTGGTATDAVVINDVATTTSITVTGNLDATVDTDKVTVDAVNSTTATLAISLAGITNYDDSEINISAAAATHNAALTVTGGAGDDVINILAADTLTSADTINGGAGKNTLVITETAGQDADFTNVTNIQTLNLAEASIVTLGTEAQEAGITTVKAITATDDYVIDASAMTTDVTYTMTALTSGKSTITAGSGNDTLALGDADDTITFGLANTLTSADTINGGTGANTLSIIDTQDDDAIFTNVTNIQTLNLAAASIVTLGTEAEEAGISTVKAIKVDDDYVIDASDMTTDVTFDMSLLTTGTSTITAGSGNDTLVITSTVASDDSIFTNVTNVETLHLAAASIVTLGTEAEEAEITTVKAIKVDDDYVIDASDMTTAVTFDMSLLTTGTSTITTGSGNDTLALGGGVDTVIFAASAADNGSDTITDFVAGATGDVLDFSAFLDGGILDADTTTAATGLVDGYAAATSGIADSAVATADNKIAIVDVADATAVTAADVESWFSSSAGNNAVFADMAAGTVSIILAGESTSADGVTAWYVTTDGAGTETAVQVATLTGINSASFTENNFDVVA